MIDEAVAQETKESKGNLSMAWVDYRKAFDMVPHRWIRDMLKAVRAPKCVQRTIKSLIPKWKTGIALHTPDGVARFPIHLKRGVFQGDSLSPLHGNYAVVKSSQNPERVSQSIPRETHNPPIVHGRPQSLCRV